jgi:hypothetical protein
MPLYFLFVLLLASRVFEVASQSGVMPPQDPPRGQECERMRTLEVREGVARR